MNENWIGIEDAADYIGIKTVTLRSWIKKYHDLPAHKVGKLWRFQKSELDEWIKRDKKDNEDQN